MIRVTMEMWPRGDQSKAYPLGIIEIANVGGDQMRGDYQVRLFKSPRLAKRPGIWRQGTVLNFPRQRLGPYDLLLRALANVIGGRNREAHDIVETAMSAFECEPRQPRLSLVSCDEGRAPGAQPPQPQETAP